MQWGQFMDHDFTFTPQRRGFNTSLIKCCSETGQPLPAGLRHEECSPIEVPGDDSFYSQYNVTCMDFVRSLAAPKRDCSLGPRDQMNQVGLGSTFYARLRLLNCRKNRGFRFR